jgi:hypothetical protein
MSRLTLGGLHAAGKLRIKRRPQRTFTTCYSVGWKAAGLRRLRPALQGTCLTFSVGKCCPLHFLDGFAEKGGDADCVAGA